MQENKSITFIKKLGLLNAHAKLTDERFALFAERKLAFDWVHLGQTDVTVNQLIELLEGDCELVPPRSGHLGNWYGIANGCAGAMDFNRASTINGRGYPLIYCFNQTEDPELENGDWVYQPGSIVDRQGRKLLSLYSWNGKEFEKRDRNLSLFSPFVLADTDNGLVPLVTLHFSRMKELNDFDFILEPTLFYNNKELVRKVLIVLVNDAIDHNNSRGAFQDLFSHQVSLDGKIWREYIEYDGIRFKMGGVYYDNPEHLVDSALCVLQSVADPKKFFDGIECLPTVMPLISNIVSRVISAILASHYPNGVYDREKQTKPVNPHFHWGARDMAGYPPYRKGYFSKKNRFKSMCQTLLNNFSEIDPILFVLMPASIFMLCTTDAYDGDSKQVQKLIKRVISETSHMNRQPELMVIAVEQVVMRWLDESKTHLSEYFLNRFHRHRGVSHLPEETKPSTFKEPIGFRDLTLRQACMIVGAMMKFIGGELDLVDAPIKQNC